MTVVTRTIDGIKVKDRTYKVWLVPTEVPRAVRIDVSYTATTALGSPRTVVRSIAPGGKVGQAVAERARAILKTQEQST